MDSSKYKITSEIKWLDNLGRWVITYKSEVYPIENLYLIPDGAVWEENDSWTVGTENKSIFDLNFWFICFQYEQQLNIPAKAPGQVSAVPAVEGPTNAQ